MAQIVRRTLGDGKTTRYDVRTRIAGDVVTRTFRRRKDASTTEAELRGVVLDPRRSRRHLEDVARGVARSSDGQAGEFHRAGSRDCRSPRRANTWRSSHWWDHTSGRSGPGGRVDSDSGTIDGRTAVFVLASHIHLGRGLGDHREEPL
jgi:hypothetical protein